MTSWCFLENSERSTSCPRLWEGKHPSFRTGFGTLCYLSCCSSFYNATTISGVLQGREGQQIPSAVCSPSVCCTQQISLRRIAMLWFTRDSFSSFLFRVLMTVVGFNEGETQMRRGPTDKHFSSCSFKLTTSWVKWTKATKQCASFITSLRVNGQNLILTGNVFAYKTDLA